MEADFVEPFCPGDPDFFVTLFDADFFWAVFFFFMDVSHNVFENLLQNARKSDSWAQKRSFVL